MLTKTYLSALAEWVARFAKLGFVKARSEASTTPIAKLLEMHLTAKRLYVFFCQLITWLLSTF